MTTTHALLILAAAGALAACAPKPGQTAENTAQNPEAKAVQPVVPGDPASDPTAANREATTRGFNP